MIKKLLIVVILTLSFFAVGSVVDVPEQVPVVAALDAEVAHAGVPARHHRYCGTSSLTATRADAHGDEWKVIYGRKTVVDRWGNVFRLYGHYIWVDTGPWPWSGRWELRVKDYHYCGFFRR